MNYKDFNELTQSLETKTPKDLQEINIFSGWLYKRGGVKGDKSWKKRFFILSNLGLSYYKSNGSNEKPKGWVSNLRAYKVIVGTSGSKFEFKLVASSALVGAVRPFTLGSKLELLRDQWVQQIQNYMNRSAAQRNVTKQNGGDEGRWTVAGILAELNKCRAIIHSDALHITDEIIGTGGSGHVRVGIWNGSIRVAVKTLNSHGNDPQDILAFYEEMLTLSTLRHPEIVQMYGYCNKGSEVHLVTEFVANGSLDAIVDKPMKGIQENLKILISLARAMIYLHSHNIIHRDLKPGNVLMQDLSLGTVKVCDFGLSGTNERVYGTPGYAAPELSIQDIQHTDKVDVFSFAIIAWELFTRRRAWTHYKFSAAICRAIEEGERPTLSHDHMLYSLLKSCWDSDPNMRPNFEEIHRQLVEKLEEVKEQSTKEHYSDVSKHLLGNRAVNYFGEKESVPWSDFAKWLSESSDTHYNICDSLRYCLEKKGMIRLDTWQQFISNFSPLCLDSASHMGYTVNDIAAVAGLNFFFGYINPTDASAKLYGQAEGTYLMRFSSQVGCIALTVRVGAEDTTHYRISHQNDSGIKLYWIEDVKFRTPQELADYYEKHSLTCGVTRDGISTVRLLHPFVRSKSDGIRLSLHLITSVKENSERSILPTLQIFSLVAMTKDKVLTPKDAAHPEYQHRICGMQSATVSELRRAWENETEREEMLDRILNRIVSLLSSSQHGSRVGLAAGAAMGAPLYSRSAPWGEESTDGEISVSVYLLMDPLDIDSKQITFVANDVKSAERIFRGLYKADLVGTGEGRL
ncbi:putative serine/threonine-protein kinase/receptor [Planoprotostelium fungivorum]|uniref:Putative serine/threonine-protein kinase/receptor n=1 Tax=Planoprotostelium fungivorum TaxID=1890364 RepID=A0A2P6NMU3_9EUKA|nr:putative serine/threonine-protein kinase/receptor [Planoprotostelium fungivorum]